MGNIKQSQEIQPAELNRIAKKATSDGFAKAIKSNITVVYTEGDILIERQPNGEKVTISKLKRKKHALSNKFKLK